LVFEGSCKPLIGVVHLPPLPGSPGYRRARYPARQGKKWEFEDILSYALEEARKYEDAGFDAVIIENYGDRPYAPRVSPGQAASMAVILRDVAKSLGIPVGVNLLRNSVYESVYAAHLGGARFIRANSLCEVRVSPEGIIFPGARMLARALQELDLYGPAEEGGFAVLADIDVKHSVPLAQGYTPGLLARECARRAGVPLEVLIVTGPLTGEPPSPEALEEARVEASRYGLRVFAGSGVSQRNLAGLWRVADGFIVGSSVKVGGDPENPVSVELAGKLAVLAKRYREAWGCR